MSALRLFVTGTDTGVGKTRVVATLACALHALGRTPQIVKAVQTGLRDAQPGDAADAGALCSLPAKELHRFRAPADPWSAALAAGVAPLRAEALAQELAALEGDLILEGSGGLLVPLNASQSFADLATLAQLQVVLAIGMRLGCMSHTQLTLEACARRSLRVIGAILVPCDASVSEGYIADITRFLQGKTEILGILPHESPSVRAIEADAKALRHRLTPFL
ncbi:MAG TPA: dethiobiotin synthase [Candidatus Dormibacteraeota bacterium]|nr:dethiobiotin synthase [Candidatus Dormibacteraeota bacterium]